MSLLAGEEKAVAHDQFRTKIWLYYECPYDVTFSDSAALGSRTKLDARIQEIDNEISARLKT